jgi:hypothetical protein
LVFPHAPSLHGVGVGVGVGAAIGVGVGVGVEGVTGAVEPPPHAGSAAAIATTAYRQPFMHALLRRSETVSVAASAVLSTRAGMVVA